MTTKVVLSLVLCVGAALTALSDGVRVRCSADSPRVAFGLERLDRALKARGDRLVRLEGGIPLAGLVVEAGGGADGPGPEGYRIRRARRGEPLRLTGGDDRGAMYGLLDLSEQVRMGRRLDQVGEAEQQPATSVRAIKFNLPELPFRT